MSSIGADETHTTTSVTKQVHCVCTYFIYTYTFRYISTHYPTDICSYSTPADRIHMLKKIYKEKKTISALYQKTGLCAYSL